MIHSAWPTVSPVINIVFTWNSFSFARFWKVILKRFWRTDGWHVWKQWSLPTVAVGRPSGSIMFLPLILCVSYIDVLFMYLTHRFVRYENTVMMHMGTEKIADVWKHCKILCLLIHEANPQSRPAVITISTLRVCTHPSYYSSVFPYVRPTYQNLANKTTFNENSDHYWRDWGFGFGLGDRYWQNTALY